MLVRRAVTIPALFALFLLAWLLSPLILPIFAIRDLFKRNRYVVTRTYLMFLVYLTCEVIGVLAMGLLWLRGGNDEKSLERHYRVEKWWARTQWNFGRRLFSLRVEVEGQDQIPAGPFVLLVRHVSTFDNLLPAVFVLDQKGVRLRWVLNYALMRDPCIDLAGNRLPNVFVKGGRGTAADIRRIGKLGENLGPGEGVTLYPEGALFSPALRQRMIDRARRVRDADGLAELEALRNVLPARPGGFRAVLEACPEADVVFCAHSGLEVTGYRSYVVRDSIVGGTLRVAFWRVARADLPAAADDWPAWLRARWQEVDDWVTAAEGEPAAAHA